MAKKPLIVPSKTKGTHLDPEPEVEEQEDQEPESEESEEAPAEAPPLEPHYDPKTDIGLDYLGTGTYDYITAPAGWDRDRVVSVGGANFEHVADNADDCWLYRRM